ncbi:hypothetical protein [Roseisolibacter sp. H3M3-2]|uniref:hypothetical protein n=1 Tax=Roseisolibacter sp. H3M3-2 TaxID=3031323 RepID=UPI0023DC4C8A|nr:hypothetical protein [Roseisolibacter sp. H3M3-2]MDF1501751.1 hypothetical protein [Roseisolibacter sp. H3M3-2]
MRAAVRAFDRLEGWWEAPATQRGAGKALVATFVAALVAIELGRRGWVPAGAAARLPRSHFGAVVAAFTALLLLELVALVFAIARSVADSVGKQFELLSLILVRKAFLEISGFDEPVTWASAAPAVPHVLADLVGALAVFVLVALYDRAQRHRAIAVGDDQAAFVAGKKLVALALLAALLAGLGDAAWTLAVDGAPTRFLEVFFTVLIFGDILLVLLSLTYSADYAVVFRNSGFAAATVMIRLALTAPPYVNALLGAGAAAFALALSVAYERLTPGPRTAEHRARRR